MDVRSILDGKNPKERQALSELVGFINETTLLDLASRFSSIYKKLAKESTDHFLITPVTALPTGKEKGKFVSIDVGGTNLRVGFIELLGELNDGTTENCKNGVQKQEKIKRSYDRSWPIEDHLKMDQAEDLFVWIGDCIAEVISSSLDDIPATGSMKSPFGEELLLGITFSFPMKQTCLCEATLLPMGKGFAITSNLDLGKMLLAGYERHIVEPTSNVGENGHVNGNGNGHSKKRRLSRLPRIRLAAITNDTVATFASLAYAVKAAPNSRVSMGLIVGTGTNATVPMKLSALHPDKIAELARPEDVETVVINTEWTIRGTDAPLIDLSLKTKWDLELDACSEAPGFQPFEYMTAGRYLGEIVRLVFVDLTTANQEQDFAHSDDEITVPPSLQLKNALPTRFLSEVVAADTDIETLTKKLRSSFPWTLTPDGDYFWTPSRVQLLRDIAFAVQQRSSALIAAACVGLLDCVGDISIDRPVDQKEQNGNGNGDHSESSEHTEAGAAEQPAEELVIAYTGSTISHYPSYVETCQRWIDVLVKNGSSVNASKRVALKEALDGGIVGAGVLAGMTDDIA